MTTFDWSVILLSIVSVMLIPAIALMVNVSVKWTKAQDRIENLTEDMRELVDNKDKIHAEMLQQMREDRAATDRRLRWLEENLWRFGVRSTRRGSQSGS